MSLADDFIRAADLPLPETKNHFARLAKRIKAAQRFEIAPDTWMAVRNLLLSRPSTLCEAAFFARPPFESCWLEWTPPGRSLPFEGQYAAARVGALIETVSERAFKMMTLWRFSPNLILDGIEAVDQELLRRFGAKERAAILDACRLGVSGLQAGFDFSEWDTPSKLFLPPHWGQLKSATDRPDLLAKFRDDERNTISYALKDPSELLALRRIEHAVYFRINADGRGYETLTIAAARGHTEAAIHDIEDEMGHVFATLALMNAKNCVEITKRSIAPALQKARAKTGKRPLLDYSTITLHLSRTQTNAANASGMTHDERRRHLVRGHFKSKYGKLWWWSPHFRGSLSEVRQKRVITS